jgi:DNA primase
MARIPEAEIERLKAEVSLVRLVESSGVKLEKRGADHVGRCPFHDDKTPSLVITPAKNLWRCFGACDVGGDVIGWVVKREGVSFRHAVELLRDDYVPAAAQARTAPARSVTAKLPPIATPAEDAALLDEVVGYYHTSLKQTPEALAYLEKRGLVHGELIDAFRLGYADRTLGYRLPSVTTKAGLEVRDRLKRVGVLRESGHEHFRGSLVVPIMGAAGADGVIQNLYGRKIRDDLRAGTPDHLYLPGPHRGVFNPAAVAASEELILTEALIDALTFWTAGYRHVTSAYGAAGFTDELLEAMAAGGVKRVLIAFDRDAAGDKGAAAVAERLAVRGIAAFRVNFPKAMDANAYGLAVQPARKSLGALLRAAEWMAGVPDRPRHRLDAAQDSEPEPPAPAPIAPLAAEERTSEPAPPAEPETLPEPAVASPIPPGSASVTSASVTLEAEISDHGVVVRLGDRTWRARGLARNTSAESLKVNLRVWRSLGDKSHGDGGEAFHVDSLDLLSAKARAGFAAEAAVELGLPVEAVKRDLGQVLLKLETVQDAALEQARLGQARRAADAAPAAMSEPEESEALAWLKGPDLLARIAADVVAIGVVGEEANAQAVYLAALSRKLDKPLAVLIQSTSAAGKSALMDAVLDLVPEEERIAYSAMTGQSLFYLGEADLKHKVLAIAEEEGARQAAYALKLLQSQGTLTIASTGKDPATGKLVTQDYTVEGPVALMLTTTAIDLDEELKNRCLVLSIDESREQTRAIHARQRFEETLEGLQASQDQAHIRTLHRNAQRLIRPLKVVNPFAERLTFQDDKTRTRRDHRKYLALIRTIALLHQHQRPIRSLARRGGEPTLYVEATAADIEAANRLAHAVLGSTLDELPPQTRRLVVLVRDMVAARASAEGLKPREVRFTRREVREATGWGDTQLRVHLGRLEELEYVLSRRDAGRVVYELAWSGEGQEGEPFVMGLIDISDLAAAPGQALREHEANGLGYDDGCAGGEDQFAGRSRPPSGPAAGTSRGAEHRGTPKPDKGLPDLDAPRPKNARLGAGGAVPIVTVPVLAGHM